MLRSSNQPLRKRFIRLRLRHSLATAAALAARLGVSERTIYREIGRLRADGVRILGEPGVGYMIKRTPVRQANVR